MCSKCEGHIDLHPATKLAQDSMKKDVVGTMCVHNINYQTGELPNGKKAHSAGNWGYGIAQKDGTMLCPCCLQAHPGPGIDFETNTVKSHNMLCTLCQD